MDKHKMDLDYFDKGDKRVIQLPEKIDVYSHIDIKDEIIFLLKETNNNLVFDMNKMDHIESSGISVIVTIQKLLENDNRKLYLSNLNENIIEVMDYCRIPYSELKSS